MSKKSLYLRDVNYGRPLFKVLGTRCLFHLPKSKRILNVQKKHPDLYVTLILLTKINHGLSKNDVTEFWTIFDPPPFFTL